MDEEALLAGVRAEPDDDLVRLAYADWLDENGRAGEAELIRVQLELAAMGEHERRLGCWLRDNPRFLELDARESVLAKGVRDRVKPILDGMGCELLHIRRGLAESVMMRADAFLTHGAELMRRFPVVSLCLTDVGAHLRDVVESLAITGARDLFLADSPTDAGSYHAFTQAAHLSSLRTLGFHLSDRILNKRAVRALAAAPPLRHLRRLALRECGLGTKHVEAVADSVLFGCLEEVDLSGNSQSDRYTQSLEHAAPLPRLGKLVLSRAGLSGYGIQHLGRSPWLARLVALDLSQNENLGGWGVGELANHADLRNLRELDLGRCLVGDYGAHELARSATTTSLRDLFLHNNQITDDGAEALAGSPNFPHLLDLNLLSNPITDPGGRALADSPHLPREAVLHLDGAGISAQTREALRRRYRGVIFNRPEA